MRYTNGWVANEEVRPHVEALANHYGGVFVAAKVYANRYEIDPRTAHRLFAHIRSGSPRIAERTHDRVLTLRRAITAQRRVLSIPLIPVGEAEWQEEALCAQLTPEAFDSMFYAEGTGNRDAKRAQAICARCPVWEECIRYAAEEKHSWDYGVVGGLSQHERRKMSVEQAIRVARAKRQETVA